MAEYQNLINDGWEENGTIQCAMHGGDHEATILVDPNNPENLKFVCSQDGDVYE